MEFIVKNTAFWSIQFPLPGRLEFQVTHRFAMIDQLFQGVDPDAKMAFHESLCDLGIRTGRFDALGDHGLVTHQQECTGWNMVEKPNHKDGSGLHVDGHDAVILKIILERLIVLPDTPVGSVYGTGPVVALMFTDGARDRLLQGKRRQGRDLLWKV